MRNSFANSLWWPLLAYSLFAMLYCLPDNSSIFLTPNLFCCLSITCPNHYFHTGNNEFDLDSWDDEECKIELRFAKSDLALLQRLLGIPNKITCQLGATCSGVKGLCIFLKRLAYPCKYFNMAICFGRNPSKICLIFNKVLDLVYDAHHHCLES